MIDLTPAYMITEGAVSEHCGSALVLGKKKYLYIIL